MSESMTFPTLYKRTATGAIEQWSIWVNKEHVDFTDKTNFCGVIHTKYGQLGGKLQTTSDTIRAGKNIGKANETDAWQQACAEAQAKWAKRVERQRYVASLDRAQAGETDAAGGVPPMLAKVFADVKKKFPFPCDGQKKFNGNRVIAVIEDGCCTLWSRKQKQITSVPHIVEAYEKAFVGHKGRVVFDGEGYRFGWSLQKISGFFRSDDPKEGYQELGHFVYDLPSHPGTWAERRVALAELFRTYPLLAPIHQVETVSIENEEAGWAFAKANVLEGYEGAIFRNWTTPYEAGKRSWGLAKAKTYIDQEFEIIGFKSGRGKFEGLATFVLANPGGLTTDDKTFDCCAPGTLEDRAEYFRQGAACIGKQMTVRFFEWSETNVPLQPTGCVVRDYE